MKSDSKSSGVKSPPASVSHAQKQKQQFVVVAVLLLGLLVALFATPKRGSQGTASGKPAVANLVSLKPPGERTPAGDKDESMERIVAINELPKLSFDEISSVDLFQRALIESTPATVQQPPAEKRTVQYKVGAVYGDFSGTSQMALIDGKIVKSGQELDSGMKVLAISPEGVQVAP